eukprot:355259-Chlamydomonas_euryale.AAC.2
MAGGKRLEAALQLWTALSPLAEWIGRVCARRVVGERVWHGRVERAVLCWLEGTPAGSQGEEPGGMA